MTAPDAPEQRAYSTKEVAKILGVPYEQVRQLIVTGELARLRIGRHYRVPDFEIERYLHTARPEVA